jgi:hypothetical protein
MKQVEYLKKQLRSGEVYRRADLEVWSNAVDRHLKQLTQDGSLEKLSGGLYYAPRQTVFGKTPAEEHELIASFLKEDRFVVTSPNDYNTLGVGTSQLYNERTVYNQKRHGTFKLGNRSFRFMRKNTVPTKLTPEFLLVDLMNNMNSLAEDQPALLGNIQRKATELNRKQLKYWTNEFGSVGTKKKLAHLLK